MIEGDYMKMYEEVRWKREVVACWLKQSENQRHHSTPPPEHYYWIATLCTYDHTTKLHHLDSGHCVSCEIVISIPCMDCLCAVIN